MCDYFLSPSKYKVTLIMFAKNSKLQGDTFFLID